MFAGNRLKILRKRKNLTQNDLSDALGFEAIYGYKRVGQYEREQRHPKDKIIYKLAKILSVHTAALMVPDIPSYPILMQFFFALEDEMGFSIHKNDDGFYFTISDKTDHYNSLVDQLNAWLEKSEEHKAGNITDEQYDEWRYNYPESMVMDFSDMLNRCWAKAQEENAKRDKNGETPEEDLIEKFDENFRKIRDEHFAKHPEDASEEYLAAHPEILENYNNTDNEE